MRHRVTVQSKSVSQGTFGEPVETWSEVYTGWAAVVDVSGREGIQGRAELQEASTRIVMRNRETVTPEMRAVWGAHTFEIRGVVRDERRTHMELFCVESL